MYKTFVPKWTKHQFVAWANKRFGGNHSNMKKKQLVAIFINTK